MRGARGLRELLSASGIIVAPGAYDAVSARLVERAGFPAVYIGSYATAAGPHPAPHPRAPLGVPPPLPAPRLAFRLDDDQEVAAIDLLAHLHAHLRHAAGSDGGHVVLHLHGLQRDERLAGDDPVARGDADGHRAARHGRCVAPGTRP